MGKIIAMKGLPGSGKSTKAKELLKTVQNSVRVNKDCLREMAFFNDWTPKREAIVDSGEMDLINFWLGKNKVVIVDDTNLGQRIQRLKNVFFQHTVEVVEVNTPLQECILRDSLRTGKAHVGRSIITNMALANGHVLDKPVVLVDVDGTVADIDHRLHFVKDGNKDWKSFFANVDNDTPCFEILNELNDLYPSTDFHRVVMSGRPETLREETEKWLTGPAQLTYTTVIMRGAKDSRSDDIVKRELFNRHLTNQTVVRAYDDRPRVVRVWESMGIPVRQCGSGIEF